MNPERRSAPRYGFTATVELSDTEGRQIVSTTSDLSRFGCHVRTNTPFSAGTKVKLKITNHGATFEAEGTVAYAAPGDGMGIRFGNVDTAEQIVLQEWVRQASTQGPRIPAAGLSNTSTTRHRRMAMALGFIMVVAMTAGVLVWLGVL